MPPGSPCYHTFQRQRRGRSHHGAFAVRQDVQKPKLFFIRAFRERDADAGQVRNRRGSIRHGRDAYAPFANR